MCCLNCLNDKAAAIGSLIRHFEKTNAVWAIGSSSRSTSRGKGIAGDVIAKRDLDFDVFAEALRVKFDMEITMRQSDRTFVSSQLEYDAWRDLFRSKSGRYYSEGIKPSAFTGWVRPVRSCIYGT